jgi:hypothetical protein
MFHGGWRIEKNIIRYLERRPSIEEMKTILEPMCYLFEKSKVLYDERYKSHVLKNTGWSEQQLKKNKRLLEDGAVKTKEDATKARDYQIQLSRQLLKELMAERGIPYDENEAKMTSVYSRHGKYAIPMVRQVPELCDALKQDWPEASNEDIKAKILEEWSKELKYLVASPEEVIQSCWPDWLLK